MSRLSQDSDSIQEAAIALVRAGAHQIAAATSLTSSATGVAITYTTDSQAAFAADGLQTIADGDAITAAENLAETLELKYQVDLHLADIKSLYDKMEGFRVSGIRSTVAAPVRITSRNRGITFTFTTDAPSITVNNAITVADGDGTTLAASIHEAVRELIAEFTLQRADLSAMCDRFNALYAGDANSLRVLGACPSLTAHSNPIAWTFTTDNPNITPNAAVTISDGDAAESPPIQRFELVYEYDDQVTKAYADIAAMRTTLNLLLKQAGIP